MTDTITPAVAHRVLDVLEQSPHIGPDGSLSALFIIRDAVKAWEAESDREEEAEFYAKVYHRARRRKSPVLAKWDSLPDDARADNIHIMRVVLDRLATDGRLLPEGGTVLTYDEGTLHRVYAALGNAGLSHRVAEDVVNEMQNLGILFRERTSSESQNGLDFDVPPAVSVPDSGPDGTPEKPWPTWQDVPEGVRVRGTGMDGSISKKGDEVTHWHPNGAYCCLNPLAFTRRAPFVRVDGDKA